VAYVAGNIAFVDLRQHRTPRRHLDRATNLAAEPGLSCSSGFVHVSAPNLPQSERHDILHRRW
jgi:hypothetical protein